MDKRMRPGDIIVVGLWFGLVTGLAEVAVLAGQKLALGMILEKSRDVVWMAPLAGALSFTLLGCALAVGGRWYPRLRSLRTASLVFAFFGFSSLLIMLPKLHHYAAVPLAAGLAVQTARVIGAHPRGFLAIVRRTLGWVGGRRRAETGVDLALSRRSVVIGAGATIAGLTLGVRSWDWVGRPGTRTVLLGSPRRPSVLLIVLDTVRAASLSLYGYGRPTTPRLQQISQGGVVFERALSAAPWTLPSIASMLTGRWPHELSADYTVPLDRTYPTLPEFLRARGYATAGFVANMRYCGYESGLERGFAHYEDYPASLGQLASSSSLIRTVADNFRLRRAIENDEHLNRKTAEAVNRDVIRWLTRRSRGPFFVFVNYFDAHEPYLPPSPYDRRFGPARRRGKYSPLHHWLWDASARDVELTAQDVQEEMDAYDGSVAYLDDQVGMLLDECGRRGLLEDTLVIITADHGEEFGEHGVFEHGYSLYLPSVHVPLVMLLPGRVPSGTRIPQPVSLRDLAPTVVDLLEPGGDSRFPGSSLARHWAPARGENAGHEAPLLAEVSRAPWQRAWFPVSKGDMRSLVHRGMRYIRNGDAVEELYDLYEDPWEKRDLARADGAREILAEFRLLLNGVVRSRSA